MGIDHDGVGEIKRIDDPAAFREQCQPAAISRVDVQPYLVLTANCRDLAHWIDARRRGRSNRRDNRQWFEFLPPIGRDRFAQRRDVHPKFTVTGDLPDIVFPQPERDRAFVDGAVRLVGNINAKNWELRAARETERAHGGAGFLARGGQCVHGRDRGGVIDDAAEVVG